ncbi:hypothetical protein AA0Z99_00275 [Agrococcus sp. 1P02AA]|uniref:hypothetical protein n=1 Tax=Agrococcus sp. 1P02AA TaxID=3132259 RepID=UPI0039A5660B
MSRPTRPENPITALGLQARATLHQAAVDAGRNAARVGHSREQLLRSATRIARSGGRQMHAELDRDEPGADPSLATISSAAMTWQVTLFAGGALAAVAPLVTGSLTHPAAGAGLALVFLCLAPMAFGLTVYELIAATPAGRRLAGLDALAWTTIRAYLLEQRATTRTLR